MTDQLSSSDWEKRRNTHTCQSFCYNQRCNGKLKLYYLDNAWIPLLESNCLGKQNIFFKKPYHVPCASWRAIVIFDSCFAYQISDLWVMQVCHNILPYVELCWNYKSVNDQAFTWDDYRRHVTVAISVNLVFITVCKIKKKIIFDIFKGKILKALLAFEVFFF